MWRAPAGKPTGHGLGPSVIAVPVCRELLGTTTTERTFFLYLVRKSYILNKMNDMLVHGVIFRKKPFHVSTVRLQVGTFCKVICEASVEGGKQGVRGVLCT